MFCPGAVKILPAMLGPSATPIEQAERGMLPLKGRLSQSALGMVTSAKQILSVVLLAITAAVTLPGRPMLVNTHLPAYARMPPRFCGSERRARPSAAAPVPALKASALALGASLTRFFSRTVAGSAAHSTFLDFTFLALTSAESLSRFLGLVASQVAGLSPAGLRWLASVFQAEDLTPSLG